MKKVLLIEDDAVMRENTAEILELAQYQVTTAANGKVGAQLAKKIRPDLVICDIMMPELDGYGVIHILSKDPDTAGIPFIFLTAKTEKSEIRKGMDLGADDYLTKPFEETELLNAIESRLKKNELIRREFAKNLEGLDQFLEEAKGMKELETLSKKRPLVNYKKKEVIFHEGDVPQMVLFLNRGKVKTQKMHDDGKEYITGLYKEGEFFGYIPLLENSPYRDSAIALEECEICKIPKDDFLSLIYRNRDVAAKFIKMLSNNVAEKEKQLLSLAYDTVRKRVAEALLLLERRYREAGKKSLRIAITREDLAGMTGTASETVTRVLSDFRTEKLIGIDYREIVILNSEGLQEIQ
jgi:CRP-like cAMP-binding protein/CheY-like chemotaxis protein